MKVNDTEISVCIGHSWKTFTIQIFFVFFHSFPCFSCSPKRIFCCRGIPVFISILRNVSCLDICALILPRRYRVQQPIFATNMVTTFVYTKILIQPQFWIPFLHHESKWYSNIRMYSALLKNIHYPDIFRVFSFFFVLFVFTKKNFLL
jgi:hypothetical protein